MVTLSFSLTPEASARVHDILACLAKFSDAVSIEAKRDTLTISALNSSKSAYASFTLNSTYFSSYDFASDGSRGDGRFTCSILNKALISVFKARITDGRGRDTAIDRCEVIVQDQPDETECRFVVRMICNHGITKTYKLTYESVEVMHALFDKNTAINRWSIRSAFLKEFTDYFGPKTEQLDIYSEDGKVTFLSFTDKIMNSKNEILKHPLKTAVSVGTTDFEHFEAREKLHIIINVKDFKSIVAHADTLDTVIGAFYSNPGRPLQFSYSKDGLHCQFTLMTAGDYNGTPTPSVEPSVAPLQRASRAQSTTSSTAADDRGPTSINMPPPAKPSMRKPVRKLGQNDPSGKKKETRILEEDPDSLFVPAEEEDRRWDPADYEKDEEVLGWDASANNDSGFHPTFRDSSTLSRSNTTADSAEGLPPTQRISQVKEALW